MTKKEQIAKLNSLALMMSAHPENITGSEFNDRLNDLCSVIEFMQKELSEDSENEVHKSMWG